MKSDNNKKAMSSVILAINEFDLLGYEVAVPLDHTSPADLVIKGPTIFDSWQSVQVKTAYPDRGAMTANVCRTNPTGRTPYTQGEVNLFAIIVEEDVIIIPCSAVRGKSRVRFKKHGPAGWKLVE